MTATREDPVEVITLDKPAFEELMASSDEMREEIERSVSERSENLKGALLTPKDLAK